MLAGHSAFADPGIAVVLDASADLGMAVDRVAPIDLGKAVDLHKAAGFGMALALDMTAARHMAAGPEVAEFWRGMRSCVVTGFQLAILAVP